MCKTTEPRNIGHIDIYFLGDQVYGHIDLYFLGDQVYGHMDTLSQRMMFIHQMVLKTFDKITEL